MSTSRRDFIVGSLGLGAGALLASCGSNGLLSATPAVADEVTYPWPYYPLDAREASQRSYEIFFERHCMCGPFEAIVAELGRTHGEPYSTFPFEMLKYGAGGIGVSTVCGTVNGGAMAIGMFVADSAARGALTTELFNWYEQAELPDFVPDNPVNDVEIARSVSTSNLCHVSVSKWCDASGHKAYTAERSERCARCWGLLRFSPPWRCARRFQSLLTVSFSNASGCCGATSVSSAR